MEVAFFVINIIFFSITDYADVLMNLVFDTVFPDPSPYVSQLKRIPEPEPLSSKYGRPAQEDVIVRYVSRFNQGAS